MAELVCMYSVSFYVFCEGALVLPRTAQLTSFERSKFKTFCPLTRILLLTGEDRLSSEELRFPSRGPPPEDLSRVMAGGSVLGTTDQSGASSGAPAGGDAEGSREKLA